MKRDVVAKAPFKGKSFGALKSSITRILRAGYAPEWTKVVVTKADRERLRSFCENEGGISLVEGFHRLLDTVGVQSVRQESRTGMVTDIVSTLKCVSGEYDGMRLAERVKSGEFDGFIKSNYCS